MWSEKLLKVVPALIFLFCILEIFELILAINNLNQTEKIEMRMEQNLKALETIAKLLDEHSECHAIRK
ncbi:hypothetical protein [Helicobacter pylori]|uniref:hypothetical protein n=1 Tax=Helicobacter pylori TaxID=210 RepID=UPI0011CAEEF9|nr:hypothetical protein [Helicobacter pylori]QEE97095.1 hypothetical protein D2C89_04085 [Helicobacter pylori]QEE98122.1 hypothetical protein D2C88_01455 [Helicobacter pylori]